MLSRPVRHEVVGRMSKPKTGPQVVRNEACLKVQAFGVEVDVGEKANLRGENRTLEVCDVTKLP